MGRVLVRRLSSCAWLAGLLLAGCSASGLLFRKEAVPTAPSFWEAFDHKAMAEKYTPILRRACRPVGTGSVPPCGHGTEGFSATGSPSRQMKHFDCYGIEAEANR